LAQSSIRKLTNVPSDLFERILSPPKDDNVVPLGRELFGEFEPDTGCGAGDKGPGAAVAGLERSYLAM
jgi:hypothetical protein